MGHVTEASYVHHFEMFAILKLLKYLVIKPIIFGLVVALSLYPKYEVDTIIMY